MMNLTEANWQIFAAKAYDRPNILQSEFDEDINRLQYIKRLLTKYHATKTLKTLLVLNHLRIFYNVFGPEAGTRLLFFRMDNKDLEVLKPFLIQLSMLPEVVYGINGQDIPTADIKLDARAVVALRELK
ncbi:MAG: DUF7207 family protein [Candidatus Dormibacteria bacterium]